jgi:uncharacterized membrane protein
MATTEITTAKQAFPADALKRISQTIEEVESETNAEIRLSIREDRDESETGLELRELALKEFASLKMHLTKERTGVLLMIIFDEHKFYIYGDEGITRRSDPETWVDVAATLEDHFKQGKFEAGVHAALRTLKAHVREYIPKTDDNPDELSNEVTIR